MDEKEKALAIKIIERLGAVETNISMTLNNNRKIENILLGNEEASLKDRVENRDGLLYNIFGRLENINADITQTLFSSQRTLKEIDTEIRSEK